MVNLERYEIVKAGGWSLAEAGRAGFVMTYIQSNPDIHYFVLSAPGIIYGGDDKTTDLLIGCSPEGGNDQEFNRVLRGVRTKYGSVNEIFDEVRRRFISLGQDLGYHDFSPHLDTVESLITSANKSDDKKEREKFRRLIPSRGEWLNGLMWSDLLGFRFIDPTELIRFRKDGRLDERSYSLIRSRLKGRERFVIPGFYGLGADGEVQLFPRDGSDITGAVIAHGVNASIYRNLTNADGVCSADPRIIEDAQIIDTLTFKEYRELGNGGTKVLHRDTIIPVASVGIPINVRHSMKPESKGTMIVSQRTSSDGEDIIGVAGKRGFISLNIHKFGMNDEIGIEDKILHILRRNGISIEHVPSDTDFLSVVFDERQLGERDRAVINQIARSVKTTSIELKDNIGLLSVVGQGIQRNNSRISEMLFGALTHASVQVKGYTTGISGISITVAVEGDQVEKGIVAVYDKFIRNQEK